MQTGGIEPVGRPATATGHEHFGERGNANGANAVVGDAAGRNKTGFNPSALCAVVPARFGALVSFGLTVRPHRKEHRDTAPHAKRSFQLIQRSAAERFEREALTSSTIRPART